MGEMTLGRGKEAWGAFCGVDFCYHCVNAPLVSAPFRKPNFVQKRGRFAQRFSLVRNAAHSKSAKFAAAWARFAKQVAHEPGFGCSVPRLPNSTWPITLPAQSPCSKYTRKAWRCHLAKRAGALACRVSAARCVLQIQSGSKASSRKNGVDKSTAFGYYE